MTDMIYYYHPNVNLKFFELINTKKKAYWLGFLFADGYIKTNKGKPYRIGIEIDRKDVLLIQNFIEDLGLNPKFLKKNRKMVRISFSNKRMIDDLINNKLIPGRDKSYKIELPKLESKQLYLSFLLGFYDGDGTQKTTKITTRSLKFLKQTKTKFNLDYKIELVRSNGLIEGRKIKGKAYRMALGSKLFNEMLDNYKESLPRKRHKFRTEEERIEALKENAWRGGHKKKFEASKQELEKLINLIPLYKIGEKYGVSDKTVKKYCVRWGISIPPRGSWLMKKG